MPRPIDLRAATQALKNFYARRRRLPSFSELQRLCGYRSKGGVSNLVDHLVRKNVLARDATGRLLPTPAIESGLRLVGSVQAGFPSPAEEELSDMLSLDAFLNPHPDSCCLVKVSGDSMIEAGILPGDLVIVDRARTAKSGDIVIAQVDGEWTMKILEKHGGETFLKPANKRYAPIRPSAQLVIGGVVVANVRKYK